MFTRLAWSTTRLRNGMFFVRSSSYFCHAVTTTTGRPNSGPKHPSSFSFWRLVPHAPFGSVATKAKQDDDHDETKVSRKEEENEEEDELFDMLYGDKPMVKVAILGPPNAGKSTLFNRMLDKKYNQAFRLSSERHKETGKRKRDPRRFAARSYKNLYSPGTAIVSGIPGTTRDVRTGVGRIGGTYFELIDTAGVDGERLDYFFRLASTGDETTLRQEDEQEMIRRNQIRPKMRLSRINPRETKNDKYHLKKGYGLGWVDKVLANLHYTPKEILRPMMKQALAAARDAHLILFMFDARSGPPTSDFYETCRWLRKYAKRGTKQHISSKQEQQMEWQQRQLLRRKVIPPEEAQESAEKDGEENFDPENQAQQDNDLIAEPQRIVLLANKLEGDGWDYPDSPVWEHLEEASRAGFGSPILISALHGDGISEIVVEINELQQELNELYGIDDDDDEEEDDDEDEDEEVKDVGKLFKVFQSEDSSEPPKMKKKQRQQPDIVRERPLQLAILGRVNVGKSTLVNALLRQDRVITGATPGLTRDSISIPWSYKGRPVKLVDTAGLRKPNKRQDGTIEDMAVLDAMRAMKVADVAVLVLDAEALYLQRHELAICQTVLAEGRALVIAANKMDLLVHGDYTPRDYAQGVRDQLEQRYPMLRHTPIVAMSGLTGKNVNNLMPVVFDARARWERKIPTGKLNRWLAEVLDEHRPPMVKGRVTRIKFMAQTTARPPSFLLFCNHTDIPESYLRYLTRQFQDSFDFYGMDVRFVLKETTNPYLAKLSRRRRRGYGLGGKKAQRQRLFRRLAETGSNEKRRKRRKIRIRPQFKQKLRGRYY